MEVSDSSTRRCTDSLVGVSFNSNAATKATTSPGETPLLHGDGVRQGQRILLVAQLVALHTVCVLQWWRPSTSLILARTVDPSLGQNWALMVFYFMYLAYLAITSLQLRYDVHIDRGGLGLTASTKTHCWLLFKLYKLIPFIEELRVLTDWTIMQTSLNFWMWMKIEDAHQCLYEVRCDMNYRRTFRPKAPRSLSEKLRVGALLLVLLFFLIVGPVILFSPLNLLAHPSTVIAGKLSIDMRIEAAGSGRKVVHLYTAAQNMVETLDDAARREFLGFFPKIGDRPVKVQRLYFPEDSDSFWQTTPSLQLQLVNLMNESNSRAYIMLSYIFDRDGDLPSASNNPPREQELTKNQMDELLPALNPAGEHAPVHIMVPNIFVPGLLLDATPNAQVLEMADWKHSTNTTRVQLTLTTEGLAPQWSVQGTQEACAFSSEAQSKRAHPRSPRGGAGYANGVRTCQLEVQIASENTFKALGSSGASTDGKNFWSVAGLYSFILFVIGVYFRAGFRDSSKRMIWEELQDTRVLDDLCNGIYMARIQGLLDKEYTLYYFLVRIYRSPELLFKVSKPKVPLDENGWEIGIARDSDSESRDASPARISSGTLRRRELQVETSSSKE